MSSSKIALKGDGDAGSCSIIPSLVRFDFIRLYEVSFQCKWQMVKSLVLVSFFALLTFWWLINNIVRYTCMLYLISTVVCFWNVINVCKTWVDALNVIMLSRAKALYILLNYILFLFDKGTFLKFPLLSVRFKLLCERRVRFSNDLFYIKLYVGRILSYPTSY